MTETIAPPLTRLREDLIRCSTRNVEKAATQRPTPQLGLARPDSGIAAPSGWNVADDAPTRCPSLVAEAYGTVPRAELDARAQRLVQSTPPAPKQ